MEPDSTTKTTDVDSAESGQAILEDVSCSSQKCESIFLKQPPEIRNQIYQYLLDLDECDKVNNSGVEKYQLYTNILRACKQTYREAHGILYNSRGPIVTVAFYWDKVIQNMEDALVSSHRTGFTQSTVGRQLHLKVKPRFVYPSERLVVRFVIAGTKNIKQFFGYLKLLNYARNGGHGIQYEFNFEPYDNIFREVNMPNDQTLKTQKQLAGLFAGLRASVQTGTCKGLIDADLQKRFLSKLNGRVIWARAEAWEFYCLSLSKYNQATNCWTKGNLDQAMVLYKSVHHGLFGIMHGNQVIQGLVLPPNNDPIRLALIKLMAASRYNLLLARILGTYRGLLKYPINGALLPKDKTLASCLTSATEMVTLNPLIETLNLLPKSTKGNLWRMIGFISVVCGHGHLLDIYDALVLAAGDKDLQAIDLRKTIEKSIKSGTIWSPEVRNKLEMGLPQTPLQIRPLTGIKSSTIRNEHFILKNLGYEGPFYENKLRPKAVEMTDPDTGVHIIVGETHDEKTCEETLEGIKHACMRFSAAAKSVWVTPTGYELIGHDKQDYQEEDSSNMVQSLLSQVRLHSPFTH